MNFILIVVGVLVSALSEYLAASLLDLRQSVFSSMADEGSPIGIRFRNAYDETEETALSISLVDLLGIVVASVGLVAVWDGTTATMAVEIISLIVGVTLAKVVAATAGARYSGYLLRFTSIVLVFVRTIAFPALLLHRILMRVTQKSNVEEEARGELEAVVETAHEEGALDPGEYRIMTNIMRLSSATVSDVMTPRTVVFGLPQSTTVEEALKLPEIQIFSRFPVYSENDLDSVQGYVIAKDVLRAALAGRLDTELEKLQRPITFIPENITLERALEQFLAEQNHQFMVVDEHGGVEGVITMEDVLETMLGVEIVDEADHVVDLRELAKQRRDQRIARIGERIAQSVTED